MNESGWAHTLVHVQDIVALQWGTMAERSSSIVTCVLKNSLLSRHYVSSYPDNSTLWGPLSLLLQVHLTTIASLHPGV